MSMLRDKKLEGMTAILIVNLSDHLSLQSSTLHSEAGLGIHQCLKPSVILC